MMGADILSQNGNGCAPLLINSLLPAGQNPSLHAIHYHSKVASAQVKSSILLAGLYADGLTLVTEPVLSRNHTELMLNASVPTYRQKYILMAVQLHLFSHVRNYTDRRSWFPEIFLLLLTSSLLPFWFQVLNF